jgi:3'(2'), 5'-bisphosphate nucleotidase
VEEIFYEEISLIPILECVSEVSKKILSIYEDKKFTSALKPDKSPVTEADYLSNGLITKFLETYTPDIPIISEESEAVPYKVRKNWERLWILDPLDGTREFCNGTDEFTINLALIENNQPVVGIISIPYQGCLYVGIDSRGFFVFRNGKITKIITKVQKHRREVLRVGVSKSSLDSVTSDYIDNLGRHAKIPLGSSIKFVAIALDQIDCYPRCQQIMEWDTAAGHAIINSVGKKLVDLNTKKELKYNKESLINPFFIVE